MQEHHKFDAIFLPHYFYGSTHRCAGVAPAKTILHPFLHDEPAIHTRVVARLFGTAALVTHNSEAEIETAQRALSLPVFRSMVVGNVVAPPPQEVDMTPYPQALRGRGDQRPYLVYFGRMIEEKNVGLLMRWFVTAKASLPHSPRLVMVGDGPASASSIADLDIIQLARVSEEEKWRILFHSAALVQLSTLESFSLVTLEAWLAGRPVIVNHACRATARHVEACGGGFAVRDQQDFEAAVKNLLSNPDQAREMAMAGGRYVRQTYSREAVRQRLEAAVDLIAGTQKQDITTVGTPLRPAPRTPFVSSDFPYRGSANCVGGVRRGS